MARLTLVLLDDLTKELRMKAVEVYGGEKGWLGMEGFALALMPRDLTF